MAEEHEQRNGRMLFTDLDASDKGRPAVVLDYGAGAAETSGADDNFLLKPIPTIQDLASSLELDFEDDWGSAADEPPFAAGDEAGEAAPQALPENAVNRSGAPPDTDKARRPFAKPPRQTGSRPAAGSRTTARFPSHPSAAAGHAPSGDDGIPGHEGHPGSPPRSATADAPEPRLPAESAEDVVPQSADSFAQHPEPDVRPFYDILDDGDEELDILSLLSPAAAGEASGPFENSWRGGRLGLDAPRERPYGGIKRLDEWYLPPAEPEKPQEEDLVDLLDKMGGWHQPPERTGSAADTAAYPPARDEGNGDTGADAVVDASASEAAAVSSDTRRLDMFSDMDLDALWEEKLRQPKDSGESRPTGAVTRSLDMFDDIDLDSIWNEKRRRAEAAAAEPDRPPLPDAGDGGSTVILGREHLENSATVIMPQDNRLRNAGEPPPAVERRSRPSPGVPAAKAESGKKPSGSPSAVGADALDFLDDLDAFLDDADAAGAVQAPSRKSSAAPGELDIADLMSMVEDDTPGVDASIRPPVIGDDDIMEINGGFETQSQEESRIAAGRNRRKIKKKADSAASDAAPPVNDAGAGEEPDYLPSGEGEELPAGAESGLGDIPAADDSDPVPFIDESAIAAQEEEEEEEEPDPEGLDALLARENARLAAQLAEDDEKAKVWHGVKTIKKREDGEEEDDEAGEDGADDGGEEGEDAGESAAVNPMDVFSNMDDMDFDDSDGLDDEMKAMLDDESEAGEAEEASDQPGTAAMAETPPDGFAARILFYARRALKKIIPQSLMANLAAAIAWRENWWFYCDLLAAIITSASLAIIISYYIWYQK